MRCVRCSAFPSNSTLTPLQLMLYTLLVVPRPRLFICYQESSRSLHSQFLFRQSQGLSSIPHWPQSFLQVILISFLPECLPTYTPHVSVSRTSALTCYFYFPAVCAESPPGLQVPWDRNTDLPILYSSYQQLSEERWPRMCQWMIVQKQSERRLSFGPLCF